VREIESEFQDEKGEPENVGSRVRDERVCEAKVNEGDEVG
jgi:hypothetical protein